jgi:D-arabinose 1-dehydrogenase-like Zn-dependent alcohol dehydrogenase
VLIKLNATGICHSDLHFMLNDWALPKMSDLGTKCAGHEGAGVIVKVGDQVKSLKPGMRAGFKVRFYRPWMFCTDFTQADCRYLRRM